MSDVKKLRIHNANKYEYAYLLYMRGAQLKDIAANVGVTAKTLTDWKTKGGWEEKRAVKTISIDQLISKTLVKINEELDKKDFSADAFSKAVAQLKELKNNHTTVDDDIRCFMDFQSWLLDHKHVHKTITDEFLKTAATLQDAFVQYRLGNQ